MQEIKQSLEQSKYTRSNLIKIYDSITGTIVSFQKANDLSSSSLFLTKLYKLEKEAKEISNEIKTFDQVIETLEKKYMELQKGATSTNIPWTKQSSDQLSIEKWV